MTKRRKGRITPKRVRPDDIISRGPVTFARTGRIIQSRAEWRPGEFEKMHAATAERYPQVVAEIDALVTEIASRVSALPPDQLLHRAWWELAGREVRIRSESEVGFDDGIAMRMVDYIQSTIAAVPRTAEQPTEVTEEDWKALREKVGRLFTRMLPDYHVCASAHARTQGPSFDLEFEEFKFLLFLALRHRPLVTLSPRPELIASRSAPSGGRS